MEHLLGAESWYAFADIHTKMEELKGRIGNMGRLRLRLRLRIRPGKQLSLGLPLQMEKKKKSPDALSGETPGQNFWEGKIIITFTCS